mmetsp:Transcript_30088/g.77979  ORF Transcript_30088/g.77979 Transcript_30088/m.77979 type:complete len:125 (+) Transcript_30088:27-401(+)|eukprot:CAMPEP_0115850530 /NCGR_PEP_ID=MMETSP0287-20121206/12013_1 /TAXON_ID=412157 /ORGANISM="Chrysochromulina rotalis, Strain UIO044" /LENGTH=124 /DNA_ID=CAMNT_0003304533 /DNA_START=26 /DNA_END=400 /DNA_ORIENTATION=-
MAERMDANDFPPGAMKPLAEKPGHSVLPVQMRTNGSIAEMSNPMYKGIPPYTGAWADCAYDPETPGPIYHTDQVKVDASMDEVMRLYTKAVLRHAAESGDMSKDELVEFSRQWFTSRAAEAEGI